MNNIIHDRTMYNRNMAAMASSMQLGPPDEGKYRTHVQHGQNPYGLSFNHMMPPKPTKTFIHNDQMHSAPQRPLYEGEHLNVEASMQIATSEPEKYGENSATSGRVYEVLGNSNENTKGKEEVKRKYPRRYPQKWIKEATFAPFYICQSRKDPSKAYCRVCRVELAGSATLIERHIETKKHKTAAGIPEDEELPLPSKTPKGLIPRDRRPFSDFHMEYDKGDADMNFFRGVLPHIKILSPKTKLTFQLRTLELLNSFPLNGDAEEEDHLIIH